MADKGTVYVNSETKGNSEKDLLGKIARETNSIIYEASSVFPFQLFPDRIIIDEYKVTVVRRELFFKRVFPILYENISSIKVNRSMFFASMEFETIRFNTNPRPVTFLKPKDATLAKKYIVGIMAAKKAGVDLSQISNSERKKMLKEIGKTKEEVENLF